MSALAETLNSTLTDPASKTIAAVSDGARVFPAIALLPQALPFVAWQIIATEPQSTHDDPDGLEMAHVQFSCVAETYKQARDLRAAVRYDLKQAGLSVEPKERDGFAETIDAFVLLLEVGIWTAPAVPA